MKGITNEKSEDATLYKMIQEDERMNDGQTYLSDFEKAVKYLQKLSTMDQVDAIASAVDERDRYTIVVDLKNNYTPADTVSPEDLFDSTDLSAWTARNDYFHADDQQHIDNEIERFLLGDPPEVADRIEAVKRIHPQDIKDIVRRLKEYGYDSED